MLYKEVEHDPIKRAELIKDIVESISVIPDAINRSVYVKECSRIMDISEQVLQIEINKLIRKKLEKQLRQHKKIISNNRIKEIFQLMIFHRKLIWKKKKRLTQYLIMKKKNCCV